MTFIFDLPNDQALPKMFDLAVKIEELVKESGILDERKAPEAGESKEAAAWENVKRMLNILCKRYPNETGAILDQLWVADDGEKIPNFLVTVPIVLAREDIVNFFTSLARLAQ